MKVLVTGGAGFIGSNIVKDLVKMGYGVVVVDNLQTGSEKNLREVIDEVTFIKRDVKDLATMDLPTCDYVLHQGFPSSSPMYRESPNLVSEAIAGTIAVLEYAKRNGARVVMASTSSVYNGNPTPWREDMHLYVTDYYTEARVAAERLCELYAKLHGVKCVSLRYFSVYGPGEEFKGKYANVITQMIWSALRKGEFLIYGDGEQARDLVYVSDVVEANLKAMEFEEFKDFRCEVFNVGSGRAVSFNEMARMLRGLGLEVSLRYAPNPIRNYVYRTEADATKMKNLLGLNLKTSLEEGVRKTIAYYQELR